MSSPKSDPEKGSISISTIILWILVLALVAVCTLTVLKLMEARQITQQTIAQAAEILAALEDLTIEKTVAIQQDIPVSTQIEIDETFAVPVQTDVDIDHETTIPVSVAGYGTVNVTIPIHTTIPVDMTFDVPIQILVPIDTVVPVDMDVPISFDLSDTALYDALQEAQAVLAQAAEGLSGGILP